MYTRSLRLLLTLFLFYSAVSHGQNSRRWELMPDRLIRWTVKNNDVHTDHIEMSGLRVSAILHYGVSGTGELLLKKQLIFPMLRTIPNNTGGSLSVNFEDKDIAIRINGIALKEYPKSFEIGNGTLTVSSATNTALKISRTLYPSVDKMALVELIQLDNAGAAAVTVEMKNDIPDIQTDPAQGVYGKYIVAAERKGADTATINAGGHYEFAVAYTGRKDSDPAYNYSYDFEHRKREKFATEIFNQLVLETPNDTINRAFDFAKLRTTESIYDTKNGLLHGPGGGAYYAAVWANDQAEYANPFFPFLGNINGNESAINSFRQFARFMNPAYKPIPSSIIAEGDDFWNGAGDRGDMAMIAYGASRFALAMGKEETAKELWPLITWCIEYLERQKNEQGVIRSDHDELEGRFPAGKVNLSTNALAYGAYVSAADLARSLQQSKLSAQYADSAKALRAAIERYFGAEVQGFHTYRYYEGNTKLRAWICLPLVMGITERKAGTINALFSPYLWSADGVLTESGSTTFWDRATLYAFRGLLANGATDQCMPYISYYSAMRLLGEHVPYPVEAWPEGDQRHLAAESALYCRVMTEGLFGIVPTGFHTFTVRPWLPKGWNKMKLKNIRAFDRMFDISVYRGKNNEIVTVNMPGGKNIRKIWDGQQPLAFELP